MLYYFYHLGTGPHSVFLSLPCSYTAICLTLIISHKDIVKSPNPLHITSCITTNQLFHSRLPTCYSLPKISVDLYLAPLNLGSQWFKPLLLCRILPSKMPYSLFPASPCFYSANILANPISSSIISAF